ncbi:MAG TPA: ABC transporter permease [Anaeromyxobacter sp.]|nr:ABC transporter permease [Anaeromyxobacter sp.]
MSPLQDRPGRGAGAAARRLLRQNETWLALLIVVLCAAITAANPAFLTYENVAGFLKSCSMVGIMAVGALIVLVLSGSPDVSFTAIAQVVEYAVVVAVMRWGGNVYAALLLAAALGVLLGLVNGVIVHYFRVPTIIVTIATFNIYFGMLYVITRGKLINSVPPPFRAFGNTLLLSRVSALGGTYGVSLMTIVWLAVAVLGWVILRKTFVGRSIFAIGGNEVAAERLGIRMLGTRLFVFGLVGLLSGVAAVVHVSIVQSVVPNIIVGKELEVIAAVVLGGASVFGGKGTVLGSVLGVLLFAILNNGLTLLNFSSYWYSVTIGVVITVAITNSAYQQLRRRRARVHVKVEA